MGFEFEECSHVGSNKYTEAMTDSCDERYIYLHEWLLFMLNVGKYAIHGSYGERNNTSDDMIMI